MGKVNVLRVSTPIQSIAYKELSFEIGLQLQIKKLQKTKTKTLCASNEGKEEMSKSKTKISTRNMGPLASEITFAKKKITVKPRV